MNNSDEPSFADQLMKSEPGSEELRRRYEEQKLSLTERRLTRGQTIAGWVGVIEFTALVIALGYQASSPTFLMPPEWKLFYYSLIAFCSALVIGMLIIMASNRNGRVPYSTDRVFQFIGGLSLFGFAAVTFKLALDSDDPQSALRLVGFSVFIMMIMAFTNLFELIRRSKMEANVKFLELELRITELCQLISANNKPGSSESNSPGSFL